MSVSLAPTIGAAYQSFTNGGLPNNLGTIATYIAGGTTPQPTFTTSAGNVQNANPVVLDASGRPPSEIWFTDTVAYRIDISDKDGNLIKTYDNIYGIQAPFAGPIGASLVGWIYAFAGAVQATVQNWIDWQSVNVFGFMSVAQIADVQAGTLLIDVTASVNAAWACAGRRVLMPKGAYRLNSNPAVPVCGQIIGEGIENTILHLQAGATKAIQLQGGIGSPNIVGPSYVADFSISGNATANAIGIEFGKSTGSGAGILSYDDAVIERVRVRDFTGAGAVGLYLWDMNFVSLYDIIAYNNTINRVCDKTNFVGTTPANVQFYNYKGQSSRGNDTVIHQGQIIENEPKFEGSTNMAVVIDCDTGNATPGNVQYTQYTPQYEAISSGDITKWKVSVTATTGSAIVSINGGSIESGVAVSKFLAVTGADTAVTVNDLNAQAATEADWISASVNAKISIPTYGENDRPNTPLNLLVTLATGAVLYSPAYRMSFTPVPANLTIVGATPTYTGEYSVNNGWISWSVRGVVAGADTTASAANTTWAGLPGVPPAAFLQSIQASFDLLGVSIRPGYVYNSGSVAVMKSGVWAATNDNFNLSGTYQADL